MNNKLIQFGYPRKTETDQKRQQTDHEFDVNYGVSLHWQVL